MMKPNPTSDNNNNNANASSNLDVLLLAAAMVTSPTSGSNMTKTQKKSVVSKNDDHHVAAVTSSVAADVIIEGRHEPQPQQAINHPPSSLNHIFMTTQQCWPATSATGVVAHTTNMVTPPFTIELVDDIPFNVVLPTIENSTAPPKMKKMGRNGNNPFTLPLKKRFVTAAASASAAQKNPPPNYFDAAAVVHQQEEMMSRRPNEALKVVPSSSSTATTATLCNEEEPPSSSSTSSNNTKKKKYRKPQCSHPSCPNRVMNRGVCARHGARVRTCSIVDCTKYAQKGGLCIRHGAVKEYKRCIVGGCKSRPVGKEGVCARHAGIGDDDVVVGKFLYTSPTIVHSNTPTFLAVHSCLIL